MKKIILSVALIATGFTAANAAVDIKSEVDNKSYSLAGTFGTHDFEGKESAFDWAFTASNGQSYQLQGKAPSKNDVFGWKEVSITAPTPAWYMFSLGSDVDGDGSKKFDWMLLSTDMDNKAAYKLKGEKSNGTFDYSAKIDVDYTMIENTIYLGSISDSGVTVEDKVNFLRGYAEVAQLSYEDAVAGAQGLKTAVDAFVAAPTQITLDAAKEAWKTSREKYSMSEIFRLSNGPIDAEGDWQEDAYGALEGQINAWPLDEGMIDYVTDAEHNEKTQGKNIINTTGMFTPSGGEAVDVTNITADVLTALNENGGDANVATGYHAIEFLLWGQDQDYDNGMIVDDVTHGPAVAGNRPFTDYTTSDNADRRKDYLVAATNKMLADLKTVASAWKDGVNGNTGRYRAAFLGELTGVDATDNLATDTALSNVFSGMGTFAKSELANERIAIAVLDPSEEDEHSCFSDQTHRDIYLNFRGFANVMKNEYPTGNSLGGKTMGELISNETKSKVMPVVMDILARTQSISDTAEGTHASNNKTHFDWQVRDDNADMKQNIITAKNQMRTLGDLVVNIARDFGINFITSNVTDNEETPGYAD
ncbi:MAG: imelysin family protein [Campylobacterota bacterium]|nr:imelysin family protein [Campylobacterota bacterium]